MGKPKMVIIDGNSLVNRAFYALPPLTTKDGLPTNAVYGFLTMLFKIYEEQHPDYISVAFDRKEATFRHREYEGYKAQRKGMPEELAQQMPVLKDILDTLGVNRVEIEGYEADDIIGTLSRYGEGKGLEVLVVTGDRDALQLVSSEVKVIYTKRGVSEFELYDLDSIEKVYGLTPEKLVDLKGLMGDKSDNIPGVPGIGEKTALKLLHEFGSLEEVLGRLDELPNGKLKQSLVENAHQAVLSKKLAAIHRDIPINIDLSRCKSISPDIDNVLAKFSQLEFNSLFERASKLLARDKEIPVEHTALPSSTCECISTLEELEKILYGIKEGSGIAIEIVVSTDDYIDFEIYGISLAWNEREGVYIPIMHSGYSLDKSKVFERIKPIMENERIEKYGHHLKQDIIALRQQGIGLVNYRFDSEVFAYLLDPAASSYQLEKVAFKYLGTNIAGLEDLAGKGRGAIEFSELEMERVCEHMASRTESIFRLKPVMENEIKLMGMERLAYDIELPLIEVLADMELCGIKVDRKALVEYSEKLEDSIHSLTEEVYSLAGEEFNINSTRQLGEVLFNKLGLPPIKKTKTGYSTDAEVLEQLKERHPIVEKVLEYRQLVKLKSTYADGLLKAINERTGRVHSSFKQTATATGRISSTEPNLQNIPVRLELGREIRRVFVPGDRSFVFVDADYSQIELRVLAHISGDRNLIDAFRENQDIHTQTAAQVFGVAPDKVTPSMRSSAKAVNFGIIYGISDYGLSQNLKIPRKKAAEYIHRYFAKYNGVKEYMDGIVREGHEKGMVKTILGRIRYLPELKSGNRNLRSFGERMAMNTPIQGSAADIIKLAMIKVHKGLKEKALESRLILQVHDELIIEARRDEVEEVKALLKACMEEAVELRVPLRVDMGIGETWYEAK
ncbi:MAG: DNA polymerase I [Firmicutes bacterium]|nr:DNA polymerase I [Bacillota bacterium]